MIKSFFHWVGGTVIGTVITIILTLYITRDAVDGWGAAVWGWSLGFWGFLCDKNLPNGVAFAVLAFLVFVGLLYYRESIRAERLAQQLEDMANPIPASPPPVFQPSDRQIEVIRVFLAERSATQRFTPRTIAERLQISEHLALHELETLQREEWLNVSFNSMTGRSFSLSQLGRERNLHLLIG